MNYQAVFHQNDFMLEKAKTHLQSSDHIDPVACLISPEGEPAYLPLLAGS